MKMQISPKVVVLAVILIIGSKSQDIVYPFKVSVDLSRLASIKSRYESGEQMQHNLADILIPAVVKHLEDTYESYDVSKIEIEGSECEKMDISAYASQVLDSNFHIVFNYVN